jgi:hypothetical protein
VQQILEEDIIIYWFCNLICIIIYLLKKGKTYPRIGFLLKNDVSAYPYPSNTDTRIRIRAASELGATVLFLLRIKIQTRC